MAIHHLAAMTWPAVRALTAEHTIALLPAGAIEAHGPHLPLGTDVIIAEAMARAGAARLSERGMNVLILPALDYAPAPFAAAFPGTLHTPAEATTAIVSGIARSLADHGIRMMAIANAHHDPAHVAALRSAVAGAAKDGRFTVIFPDLTRRRWAEKLTDEFKTGACHAGRYEGSIVLAEREELVRQDLMRTLAPNPRSLVDAMRDGCTSFADAGGSDAYFGFPADATAEEGRRIIAALAGIIDDAVMEAIQPRG